MEWLEITAKSIDEALTEALIKLQTTSDRVEYEIIEKESSGFLGLFNKPAKIKVKMKDSVEGTAKDFLDKIFKAMNLDAKLEISYDESNGTVDINVVGDDMGILIGKRGQTLDSLQYLVSLVLNKGSEGYLKVKLDTENYRERRKETLENLARNISLKVQRTKRSVILEPMNPYERRIIHAVLQNDAYVQTHSEGDEPFRKVVVTLKKSAMSKDSKYSKNNGKYSNTHGCSKDYKSRYKDQKVEYRENKNSSVNILDNE